MGCSSSNSIPIITYTVSYCTLIPLEQNIFKINLIDKEEIPKKAGQKFFSQIGHYRENDIIELFQKENLEEKTIYFLYYKSIPEIKNFYQMNNLIINEVSNLHKIFLLSTENLRGVPNFIIEKKMKNLTYFDFIGYKIDLSDIDENILDNINNANITKDDIKFEDENEENGEGALDEIYISGTINQKNIGEVKDVFMKNNEIIKIYISDIVIEDKNSFAELINFFGDKDIKVFSLFDANINDANYIIFNSIIEILEKNYNIRSIDLHNCNLNDNNLVDIIRAISDKRIRYLDLSKNAITLDGATIISQFLKIAKTLIKLNLSNNSATSFKSEGVEYILNSLVSCPNIKYVDFSDMPLTGCGAHIKNFLLKNKSIEHLILKNILLNSNDFKNIFEAIKINKTIKELDVSFNDMGGNKIYEYIKDAIKENTSLNILRLDKININNGNYNQIFEGIENNKNIYEYSLSYNQLNPKIVFGFFMYQKQVKKLEFIPDEKNNILTLDEKKLIEKCKNERPDLNIIYTN